MPESNQSMSRPILSLAVVCLVAVACGGGSDPPHGESRRAQRETDEGTEASSEPVAPAAVPDSPASAPEIESNADQVEAPTDEPPYFVGGDVEPPRRLEGSMLDGSLIDMMRSGHYAWGACIFTVTISESGEVSDFQFLKPKDLAPEVEQAIIETVEEWRFSPATRAGQPVAVYYSLVIHHCPYRRLEARSPLLEEG